MSEIDRLRRHVRALEDRVTELERAAVVELGRPCGTRTHNPAVMGPGPTPAAEPTMSEIQAMLAGFRSEVVSLLDDLGAELKSSAAHGART